MPYITKCAKQRESKVDHASKCMTSLHWPLTALQHDAIDRSNRFTRSLSGEWQSCTQVLENARGSNEIKHSSWQRAVIQQKLTVDEPVKNGDGEQFNRSAMSDVSIAHFQRTSNYLQSDPHSNYLHMVVLTHPLVEYFVSPTPKFRLIRAVCFLLSVQTDFVKKTACA